ncbi:MAG: glycosyltransferase family 2 protein [Lachnospiraceae bacterium]|jgi:glycosyltransferase involved in cell wall biosynthesis|nr:glycosyltransferase family 2 protein [Lachnospiraceae bacterium]
MKRLVIIPAYNEEGAILDTVTDIRNKAPEFDVIVINDCSTDSTRKILEDNAIAHINLPMNLGIGGAVQTGYIYAEKHGYDVAVQMDGDGQHDASYLNDMLAVMKQKKADMVIGSRFIENKGFQSSSLRRVGINFFTGWIRKLTHQTITDPTSGMRMVNRRIIELFAEDYPKDYPEPETVVTILKNGYSISEVPVVMKARTSGESSISMRKSVYYMFKVSIACLMAAWSADVVKKAGKK